MKVAVVGSGVSGLAATWLLNEYSEHEVHLYESDLRPGGHANTVKFYPPGKEDSEGVDVDTGFIVCNPSTYPNFLRFATLQKPGVQGAKSPGVQLVPTEMTFSVSRNAGEFEWAGKNPLTVFCQPWRLLEPRMWGMVYDVLRFNASAIRVLMDDEPNQPSIGEYLEREGYSSAFKEDYLIPMTAAIWSTPPGKCFDEFPARTLIQFMYNHHLLQIIGKPSWLTLQGGSHTYVKTILSKLPESQLHLNTPIGSVRSQPVPGSSKHKVTVATADGKKVDYDHVILACHSDTALKILEAGNITDKERDVLGMFEWNKNEVVLHSDPTLMPKCRIAWSCWNYLTTSGNSKTSEIDRVSLTYGMNDLQHISETKYGPVLVTLNPPFHPDPDKTRGWWKYDHPVLDAKAVAAQSLMPTIQNKRSITFAGAWLKYGFHEDGFTSGLLAACAVDEEAGEFPTFSLPVSTLRTSHLGGDMTIQTKNSTLTPPFDIRYADHHIKLKSEGVPFMQWVVALVFDMLEATCTRTLVGFVTGTVVLGVLRMVLRHDLLLRLIATNTTPDDAQLECLQHEASLLSTEMTALRKRMEGVESLLDKYRRFTCAIRRVPFEILGQIFVYALPDVMDKEGRKMLLNFGLVCKGWRNASLLKHELWSRLQLSWAEIRYPACFEGVKTWWSRSGCYPRDLALFEDEWQDFGKCQGPNCPWFGSTVTNLLSSGPSVHRLSLLEINPNCLKHLLKSVSEWHNDDSEPSTWENLKSLSIHFDDDYPWAWSDGDYDTLLCHLPPVTSLSLSLPDADSAFDTLSQSPLTLKFPSTILESLSRLNWRTDWYSTCLLDMLEGCRNLTHLTIDCQYRFALHKERMAFDIHLPRLAELRIQESRQSLQLLKLLVTPLLQTLDIGFGAIWEDDDADTDTSDDSTSAQVPVAQPLPPSFPRRLLWFLKTRSNCLDSLRLLRLFQCTDPKNRIGSLLVQLPPLQELILDNVEWDPRLWTRLSSSLQGDPVGYPGGSPACFTHIWLLSRQGIQGDQYLLEFLKLLQERRPLQNGRRRHLTMSFTSEDETGDDDYFDEEDYFKTVRILSDSSRAITNAGLRGLGVSLTFLRRYVPVESWVEEV